MSWLAIFLLFVTAWLGVFAQTQFAVLRQFFGMPFDLLPALVVYSSVTHNLAVTVLLAFLCGLGVDSLSAMPFGVSVMPLVIVGVLVHLRQQLILRDQAYAQFWLGLGASVATQWLQRVILLFAGQESASGPGVWTQGLMLALANGAFCPVFFFIFDRLHQTFEYQSVVDPPFRKDREIRRGR